MEFSRTQRIPIELNSQSRSNENTRTTTPRVIVQNKPMNTPSPYQLPTIPPSKAPTRFRGCQGGIGTPQTKPRKIIPKKLFEDRVLEHLELNREGVELKDMNMELILINSLKINVLKVQTIIENFIKGK